MKVNFDLKSGLYSKTGNCQFCLENATTFHIQDMFENGKPDIVVLVMFNKMLVIVFIIDMGR